VRELKDDMDLMLMSVAGRLEGDLSCKWLDRDGYCTHWHWSVKVRDWNMRQSTDEGETVYLLNARKHPLICVACPSYEPRD